MASILTRIIGVSAAALYGRPDHPSKSHLARQSPQHRGCFVRLLRDRRGVSAVELGLAAPLLLGALSPVVDFGMAFSQKTRLQQAVQAGAQYASMNVWNGGSSPTAIKAVVTNATTLPVTFPSDPSETCACPNGTTSPYIQAADTLSTCGTTTCSDGEVSGYYVSVAAQLTYTPLMPISFLSNPTTLSATSVVRVQ